MVVSRAGLVRALRHGEGILHGRRDRRIHGAGVVRVIVAAGLFVVGVPAVAVLSAAPAAATPATPGIVSGQDVSAYVFASTVSVTLPSAPTAGNELFAWVCDNTGNGPTVNAPSGGGWAAIADPASRGDTDCAWYKRAVATGDSATVSLTVTGSTSLGLQVYEIANAGINSSAVATRDPGSLVQSLTTATLSVQANSLVLAGFMDANTPGGTSYSDTYTADIISSTSRIQAAHKFLTASGTTQTTLTTNNATGKLSSILSIAPQWTVTLNASASTPTTGATVTLSASSNWDVSNGGFALEIFDQGSGTLLMSCASGTSCSTTVQNTSPAAASYIAYVGNASSSMPPPSAQAASSSVTVTWSDQWTVALAAATATPGTGSSDTLTATANTSVSGTGFVISIFDDTTGALLSSCSSGSTCTASATSLTTGTRSYHAYVAAASTSPPAGSQASSSVDLTWNNPWTIAVSASPSNPNTASSSTLTATANASVSGTGFVISIFDASTGSSLASCSTGSTCTASVSQNSAMNRTYNAYVAQSSTSMPPSNVQASASTSVSWTSQWTVSLAPSNSSPNTASAVTLTATANASVSNTGYVISIFDASTGSSLASCSTGSTCTASVTKTSATTRSYNAYVAPSSTSMPPSNVQASASTTVAWTSQWTATLSTSNSNPLPTGSATLTATSNHTVTGSPYVIGIYDLNTGALVTSCSSGSTCSTSVSQVLPSTHTYIAYVSEAGSTVTPPNVQAISNTAPVTWGVGGATPSLWQVALTAAPPNPSGGSSVTLAAVADQPVDTTPYSIMIFDQTTGEQVCVRSSGTTCTATVAHTSGETHNYVAFIAPASTDYPPGGIQASSSTVTVTWS
jgi:hypothetical protein